MSILIEGMEMPEYCYDCPCRDHENGKCQLYKDGYLSCIERPAKCPLKEINDANIILVKQGKGPFVLLECSKCGNQGWFGAVFPKYCVNCGAKFIGEVLYGTVD